MQNFRAAADAILEEHKRNMDASAARQTGLEKDLARFRYAADHYNMLTGELMRLSQEHDGQPDEKTRIVNQILWAFVEMAKR
ncbi:hypothetical protein FLLO111716_08890 [Flavobacterium longum]|uniref:hypothetical protein n=1 Tax=Flavobacterium longum TaxID=1299340 RepID=UPI0039EC5565